MRAFGIVYGIGFGDIIFGQWKASVAQLKDELSWMKAGSRVRSRNRSWLRVACRFLLEASFGRLVERRPYLAMVGLFRGRSRFFLIAPACEVP